MNPAWSPDGNRIVYERGFRADTSIYEVPADGSGPSRLLLSGAKMAHIDWSRDGQLLFSSWAKGRRLQTGKQQSGRPLRHTFEPLLQRAIRLLACRKGD